MRLACIDIGSNTTRLLVADHDRGRLRHVHEERAFTRIALDLRGGGPLSAAKIEEVVEVVADQAGTARRLGTGLVRGVATAAVREAANRSDLLDAVRARAGLQVAVLSAAEEARLAFVGAAAGLERPLPRGDLGVVDVGGGSTELVVGAIGEGVRWWTSIAIGSGSLSVRLERDPPTAAELDGLRSVIAAALAGIAPPRPELALAVGGSATSLARLCGPTLTPATLQRGLALLSAAPAAELAGRLDLHPQRVGLMPAGLLILQAASELLGVTLRVGRGGMREGVLLECAGT